MQTSQAAGWAVMLAAMLFERASISAEPLLPLKVETPPRIDGRLDDLIWQQAPHVTGFKTFTPDYGIHMADQTFVYFAYDRENLYFAFRCFDREPDKIKSSLTRRDNIRPDDWICINLDSFNDQQALYGFYVNPAGIQSDTRFAGGREDDGIDLIWYSAGLIDSAGYVIEVQIPFKSIRFAHKEPVEMGVIFERRVSRRSEQGTFPPLLPERGMSFQTQMHPMLFHGVKHYQLFELLPATTFSQNSERLQDQLVAGTGKFEGSVTTKYAITSELILDGTYNPDFSQVESDAGQIDVNLRFALFYPEKRPFFLEGNENFSFAGAANGDPLEALVYTRQIVDPLAGINLSGKIGRKNFLAAIQALDEVPPELRQHPEDSKAYFNIVRYKRALSDDSFFGVIYTGRERKHGHNRVFGGDGQFRLNQSSFVRYHAFGNLTQNDVSKGDELEHAAGADYVYNTRNLDLNLGVQDLSSDFQTEAGFVTRTGVLRLRGELVPKFYPQNLFMRRMDLRLFSFQTHDKPSAQYETDDGASLRFVFKRNTSLTVLANYATEIFTRKFNTGGVSLSGSNQFNKYLSASFSYRRGNAIFYPDTTQGYGNTASAQFIYQPSEKINATFNVSYADLFREEDDGELYRGTIVRGRLTYQINKYLFFRGILEHNAFNRDLATDLLASFTYIPGTVLYFGYGSLYEKIKWQGNAYVTSDSFLETKRGFFAKASYLWRL
ncbi:MAG: DUF5916 domain-containing protein [bacterium]